MCHMKILLGDFSSKEIDIFKSTTGNERLYKINEVRIINFTSINLIVKSITLPDRDKQMH